jgi:hypothetical protein
VSYKFFAHKKSRQIWARERERMSHITFQRGVTGEAAKKFGVLWMTTILFLTFLI